MTKHTHARMAFIGLVLVTATLLLLNGQPVAAQDPAPTPSDNEVNRVAKQMYCPVCENIPLDVCPTQACHDWRELIRQKLAAGWTDQQIKDYFARQYGDRVLAEPPATGLNWLVYILPWVAFFAGVIIVWRVMTSMRRKSSAVSSASEPGAVVHEGRDDSSGSAADDAYLKRMEEELNKKESQ